MYLEILTEYIVPFVKILFAGVMLYGVYISFIYRRRLSKQYSNLTREDLLKMSDDDLLDFATNYAREKFLYNINSTNRDEISYLKKAQKSRRVIWTTSMLDFSSVSHLEDLFLYLDHRIIFMLESDLIEINENKFSKELTSLLDSVRQLTRSQIEKYFQESELIEVNTQFFTLTFQSEFQDKRKKYLRANFDKVFLFNKKGRITF